MKRRLFGAFLALLTASVAVTAICCALLLRGGESASGTGAVVLACAAVVALAAALGLWAIGRLVPTVDPDSPERPDAEELQPLLRRLDQQKALLRERRDKLEDRERKLTAITDNMTEGLVLLDGAGVILLMNRAAARMLEAGDRDTAGVHIFAVNTNNLMQAAVHSALGGSTSRELIDMNGMKLQAIANPVVVDGAAHGAVLMLVDVTERQAAEDMRREFSANVSHELKTPITSISGYAELMMTGMARPKDVPELAGRIHAESARLIALIDDIIKLSRLDENNIAGARAEIGLLPAAMAVADRLEPKAKAMDVTLEVSGADVSVWGDAQLIDEMIANLADNAIKYNRPGGHVWITASERGKAPVLTVRDDGIGIAPEHIDRIFERFYRVDKSHSKETGGTGLGLSIVKHGAAWHRARVEAESVPDKGTAISIVFDGKGGQD